MTRPHDPVVDRAARELRRRPGGPLPGIRSSVAWTIGRAARRTWPLDAVFPPESRPRTGDRLRVSDRVVRSAVRLAIDGCDGCGGVRLVHVGLDVDGHRCTGAHLTVVARHGGAPGAVRARLAAVVAETISRLLGHPVVAAQVRVRIDGPAPG